MPSQGEDGDGFVVVCRRRGRDAPVNRWRRRGFSGAQLLRPQPQPQLNEQTALRRIFAAKEDLKQSDYYKSFIITLKESIAFLDNRTVVEILCLGLGHIGECTISRYQLALLLCLRELYPVNCLVHDPIFYDVECDILRSLELTVIQENEEGKCALRSDGLTIVYLPHCPKQLTNNFLWKNWGKNLSNCVLICNSFTRLLESQPLKFLEDSIPLILNIIPYTQEFSLVNSFKYNDIFNDTSIHVFSLKVLDLITDNFWENKGSEPQYGDEIELITKEIIDKLNIKE